MLRRFVGLVVIALWSLSGTARGERMTLWLTFDGAKTGPAVACDGEFRASDGGHVTLQEWMHENRDAVEGAAWRLRSEHNQETVRAAKLPVAFQPRFPKGLLVEVDASPQATLSATTRLGDFAVPLARLRAERAVAVLDGKARLAWIPNVTPLTGAEAEEEYPSLAMLPDGRAAVAYVSWDGNRDRVLLRVGDEVRVVTDQPGDYMEPRCALDGRGKLWVVWAANDGRQWDLWAQCEGQPRKLTSGPRNHFWPRLARDRHGNLWLAWQTAAEDLHYEVLLARLGPDGLSAPINVSQHPADDWEPAICATPDGRIVVAWDTYRNGSFDIYLREFAAAADGTLTPRGAPLAVAASAQREAHATLAADSQGRVWLAWDVSMVDWGKHPQPNGTLHSARASDVACYADGKLWRVGSDFMHSLPKAWAKFVEYPQVAVDGHDRLWLIFRVSNEVLPAYNTKARAQRYAMWHVLAAQYDGRRWSEPVLLARSNGRQDMRVDVARDPEGELVVVYGADGRTRRLPYVPVDYDVFRASLAGFGLPMQPLDLAEAKDLGQVEPAAPDPELAPLPRQWRVGPATYRLLIGDTHRHTDISRCSNGYDGSLQDAYRYALDACGLDWLAISDHDQDILKHRADRQERPRQDYAWWRSQKYSDLYTIPGRFVALYGYEHGGTYEARGGHKNVVAAQRGLPVREVDAPHELFEALAGSGAIVIPHQLADETSRTDWTKWSGDFERVGEIFQARGSYEYQDCPRAARLFTAGNSLWDALAKGVRIGIIASSDHGQTHQARAGVYVQDAPAAGTAAAGFTRQGILDALRARRAFGATIAVALQVSVGDRVLGEEAVVSAAPEIRAKIAAPAEIARLDIVRDGRFVYTAQPKAAQAEVLFADLDLRPGQSAYYYLRAQIGENDFAWSSPLWVTRKP